MTEGPAHAAGSEAPRPAMPHAAALLSDGRDMRRRLRTKEKGERMGAAISQSPQHLGKDTCQRGFTSDSDSQSRGSQPSGSQPSKSPPDVQPAVSEEFSPEEAHALVEFVKNAKKQKLNDLKQSVSASTFATMLKVFALEEKYVADLTELTKRNCRKIQKTHREMLMDPSISPWFKGFQWDRRARRRQVAADVKATAGFHEFRIEKHELLLAHGEALVSIGAAEVLHLLLASTTTKRAVLMAQGKSGDPPASGAQSSDSRPDGSQPRDVDYKGILSRMGYIQLPENHVGRKPSSDVPELEEQESEKVADYDWAQWWMRIGGFQALVI